MFRRPDAQMPDRLDKASKVLWLLGVNHVHTGTATYINIALVDALGRQGIDAFQDTELVGSADFLMADGPYANLSRYFFAVRFSRDCEGLSYCKTVPMEGPRSLSLSRPALIILRAYINPLTGVGPDATALLNFRTVTTTPQKDARAWDSFERSDTLALFNSSCTEYIYRTTLCSTGPTKECCDAIASWNREGCWCDSIGQKLLAALPIGVGPAALVGVARICSQRSNVSCTSEPASEP
ncbi:hypothetical protein FOA52_004026 [Chlamydomonas sp. UWO 241]|nr:hypothetical protein FOA52_004026 [Chlamydomonas sp. UWO 241]